MEISGELFTCVKPHSKGNPPYQVEESAGARVGGRCESARQEHSCVQLCVFGDDGNVCGARSQGGDG